MSAQHTPGPWEAHCEGGSYGVFDKEDGREIARLHDKRGNFPQSSFVDAQYLYDGQHEANARLIAAAPELLAAGEGMLALLTQWDFKSSSPTRREAIAAMLAAIAKAKGLAE